MRPLPPSKALFELADNQQVFFHCKASCSLQDIDLILKSFSQFPNNSEVTSAIFFASSEKISMSCFACKTTNGIPKLVQRPPEQWVGRFEALAQECNINLSLEDAYKMLSNFFAQPKLNP